jgi:hypothetical protein
METEHCVGECEEQPAVAKCLYEDDPSAWSSCSQTCGDGVQHRTSVLTHFLGYCDPLKHEARKCNLGQCEAEDCQVSEWMEHGECSSVCGAGQQRFVRTITKAAKNGGKCDKDLVGVGPCVGVHCPVDCVLSDWERHGECSSTCGSGTEEFVREVVSAALNGGKCDDPLIVRRPCNGVHCPVNCTLSDWVLEEACNAVCGSGFEIWGRLVELPARFGGDCSLPLVQHRSCDATPCEMRVPETAEPRVVGCTLSAWMLDQPCNVTGCDPNAKGVEKWIRVFTSGDCFHDTRHMEEYRACSAQCMCKYAKGPWSSCCRGTQTRTTVLKKAHSSIGCNDSGTELRSCTGGSCEGFGNQLVSCLGNTNEDCSMFCEWCNDHVSWKQVYERAKNLVFFTPAHRGRHKRSLSGPGESRLWKATEFRVTPGVKLTDECKEIKTVKQVVSRNRDPDTKCHVRFGPGREYLISGACDKSTFYVDPCGVKFDL